MLRFLRSLRGKLILTYTFVTVLALLALEIIVLMLGVFLLNLTHVDRAEYLSDVQVVLGYEARQHVVGQEVDWRAL